MPIMRVVFAFRGNGEGWSEVHLMNTTETNPQIAVAQTLPVAQARAKMLARPFQLFATRVSNYSNGANPPVKIPRSSWPDKSVQGPGGTTKAWDSEPKSVQLQAIGTTGGGGVPAELAGNKNTTYLGAPPDVCVTDDGRVVKAANDLLTLFNLWRSAMLQAGFGWGASLRLGDLAITTIAQNTNGTVKFTVAADAAPPLTNGRVYPIRVRQVNQGRSPLNGQLNATWNTAAKTFDTLEVLAFSTAQTNGMIAPYSPVNLYVPYTNIQLADQVIEHKRGRPPFSVPGRRSKRVRG